MGVEDQSRDSDNFGRKFSQFHSSPVVMMTYQFVSLEHFVMKANYDISCDFIVYLYLVLTCVQLLDVVSNEIFRRIYQLV